MTNIVGQLLTVLAVVTTTNTATFRQYKEVESGLAIGHGMEATTNGVAYEQTDKTKIVPVSITHEIRIGDCYSNYYFSAWQTVDLPRPKFPEWMQEDHLLVGYSGVGVLVK